MKFATTSDAVLWCIGNIIDYGEEVSPRGQKSYEWLNAMITVLAPNSKPIVCRDWAHNIRMERYLGAEMHLYHTMENRAEVYARHAKLWAQIANPDGTINSCYGKLIFGDLNCRSAYVGAGEWFSQWEWAKRSLQSDPDTRQAIVRLNHPIHQWWGNKDFPCTMHLHFLCRGRLLHLTAVMRSCDVTRGLPYDMPYFVSLQERMAKELGLTVGYYTHIAHSLHLYESEMDKAMSMIGRHAGV